MQRVNRWLRLDPVLVVALALLGAAALVVHLQRQSLSVLEQQSTVILETVLEQAAGEIALDVTAALEEPAYDTLRAFRRADLLEGSNDRVLRTLGQALEKYPQVDRFFIWSDETEARVPGEVLFYDRNAASASGRALTRDRGFGRLIFEGLQASSAARKNYTALEYRVNGCTYDVFAHNYWNEPDRDRFFFLLGFVVCVEEAGKRLLPELYDTRLADWLKQGSGGSPFELHIFDEQHRLIFGTTPLAAGIAGSASLTAQFYPWRLSSLAVTHDPREWTVRVSSAPIGPAAIRSQSYWLLGLSVMLMLVALTVAVRSQTHASELARMQSEFVSHVSHQLRTPLSLLTTVTDTLALDRVKSPEKRAQYVDILRTETNRLSTLVERILEFSRVDGRDRRYQFEPVNLVPLVRETVAAFAQKPAAEGFTIEVVETGAPPAVQADPAALEQVLLNLLDNAVKYSDHVREVTVRVGRVANEAVVEVQDKGIGIPKDDEPHIFERFHRGSGAGRRSGFGLGLAIVQAIVTAHRGRVEVQSVPGRGSLFRVRLPLQDSHGRVRGPVRVASTESPWPAEDTKPV